MATKTVYLIGPESTVFHATRNCPALTAGGGQWPVSKGVLLSDGSTVQTSDLGRHYYRGRRPCKRCHAR